MVTYAIRMGNINIWSGSWDRVTQQTHFFFETSRIFVLDRCLVPGGCGILLTDKVA